MKDLLVYLLVGLVLSACNSRVDDASLEQEIEGMTQELQGTAVLTTQEVVVDSLYSITLPDYMKETSLLNDAASLQYSHLMKEQYAIVIDMDKQELKKTMEIFGLYDDSLSLLDNYAEFQVSAMEAMTSFVDQSDWYKEKVNGLGACLKAIDANIPGVPEPVSYWVAYIEGKEKLYAINVWTLSSRKGNFQEQANEVIRSFKEL